MKSSNYQNFGGGGRECRSRYETIRPHLPSGHPFAVLDVGSNMGFFSVAIAADFPNAVVHSIDHQRGDCEFHLRELRSRGLENNYIYRALLDFEIARHLFQTPTFRVFDATLLLSVVHHFHYPFKEWAEMVGNFFRHSRLTFLELPSLQDAEDIAAIDKFKGWYANYPQKPYESLVQSVLSICGLERCQIQTLRTEQRSDSSKDTRHLLLVTNQEVMPDMPRFHCQPIMATPGIFLFHPHPRRWQQHVWDAKTWTLALPRRARGKLIRLCRL